MHSHHSHSGQFCRHAKDNLEQVVSRAVELGFDTYGLSEHAPRYREEDLFPEEIDLKPEDLERIYDEFLKTATRLQAQYRDRIRLLVGLETDYITYLDLQRTKAMLNAREEIQYVVGSVHHVAGVSIDFDESTYLRSIEHSTGCTVGSTMVHVRDPSDTTSAPRLELPPPSDPDMAPHDGHLSLFLQRYLEAQCQMIDYLQPEVIGHFDLCLLFNPGYSLQRKKIWEKAERNIRRVISYGGLFEANGAALRKGWDTSYPSRQVLELIIELGGRICLSDDSHGVAQVGLNYERMKDYLVSAGVKEVWYLVASEEKEEGDEPVGSRNRVVARRSTDWADKSHFWARCPRT